MLATSDLKKLILYFTENKWVQVSAGVVVSQTNISHALFIYNSSSVNVMSVKYIFKSKQRWPCGEGKLRCRLLAFVLVLIALSTNWNHAWKFWRKLLCTLQPLTTTSPHLLLLLLRVFPPTQRQRGCWATSASSDSAGTCKRRCSFRTFHASTPHSCQNRKSLIATTGVWLVYTEGKNAMRFKLFWFPGLKRFPLL